MDSTADSPTSWLRRFGSRFFPLYLGLHALLQFFWVVPGLGRVDASLNEGWRRIAPWIGRAVLGLSGPIYTGPSGSSDTTLDWIQAWCLLVLAFAGAAVWAACDRARRHDPTVQEAGRTIVRYLLGAAMLHYGFMKLIPPTQFPTPSFYRLLEPLNEFSPEGVLWNFMGFSPAYQAFSGLAELVGGTLLFFRRTTLLGALVTAGVMLNVVLLNFCYDVPVKLYSSHLLAMAVWLAWPDHGRLMAVFMLNRPAAAAPPGPAWPRGRMRPAAAVARVLFVGGLVYGGVAHQLAEQALIAAQFTPAPAELRGLWNVETFERDGTPVPPLTTETARWRTLIIGDYGALAVRRMDNTSRGRWLVKAVPGPGRITLAPAHEGDPPVEINYTLPEPGRLQLAGTLDGATLRVTLRRVDETKFNLFHSFHWVTETPFNR